MKSRCSQFARKRAHISHAKLDFNLTTHEGKCMTAATTPSTTNGQRLRKCQQLLDRPLGDAVFNFGTNTSCFGLQTTGSTRPTTRTQSNPPNPATAVVEKKGQ